MKLIVAGIAGLLAVLLLAMLHTQPARERVLGLAQEYLEAQQNIELRAGQIDYNLLTLTVWLNDVSLRAKAPGSPPPFLTAESVAVNFDIARLPFGALIVQDAAINGLELQIIQGPGSEGNLPSAPETAQPDESGSGLQFIVEKLSVPGASFQFEDRESLTRLELPGWRLRVEGDRSTLEHQVEFETETTGSLAIADARTVLNRIHISARVDAAAASVEEAVVETASSRVALSGTIENWAALNLDLRAQSHIGLEEAGRLAGFESPPSGTIEAEFNVSGTPEVPRLSASVNGTGLGWRSLRDLELTTNVDWDGQAEQLTVNKLEAQSSVGSVTANALLTLAEGGGESRLDATLRRIDLSSISREAKLPVEIASRLSARVDANWDGLEWKTASGSLNAGLTPALETPAENRLPVSGQFEASGSADDLNLTIEVLRALGSRWSGSASLTDFERLGGELRGNFDAATLNSELAALLEGEQDWPGTAGSAEMEISLGGVVEAPTATAQLTAGDLQIGELEGVALALNSGYTGDSLAVESLSVTWQDQRLLASGTVGLDEDNHPLALDASIANGRIESILSGLGSDIPASGAFTADARITGTRYAPQGVLSLKAEGLSAYQEELGQLVASVRFRDGVAYLESAQLTTPESGTLQATGNYNLDANTYGVDVSANGLEFDTLTLPDGTPARGSLSLAASGSGSLDDPRLTANLLMENVIIGSRDLGDFTIDASASGETGEFQFQAPDLSLRGAATARLEAPYESDFTIEAAGADLTVFAIPGSNDDPIGGSLTARIDGSAPLSDLLSGRITAEIEQLRLMAAGRELRNTSPIEARLEGGTIHVDSLAVETGESSLSATGALPVESAQPGMAVRIEGDLKLADLLAFANLPDDVAATGQLHLSGSIAGSIRQPVPQGVVRLSDGALEHPALRQPVTGLTASLAYEDGMARIEQLNGSLGTATFEATGEAPVSPTGQTAPARLEGKLTGLSLGSFTAVPEQVDSTISVRITGETPALADWKQLRAEAVFDEFQVTASGLALQQGEPSRLVIRQGVASIESLTLSGPQTEFTATGEAGLLEDGTMDVALTGSLDAGVASLFADGLQADGPIRLELTAAGPTRSPDVTGYAEWQQGQFAYTDRDISAESLDVRLDFTREAVTISRFSGMLNGGPMSASGRIPLGSENSEELGLGLTLRNGFFNIPEGLMTQVWATLMVQPEQDEYRVGGIVKILDGSYREPLAIEGELIDFLSRSDFEMPADRNPFLEKLNFDITVETKNPMVVDNNLMGLSLESDLHITGDFYQPGMTGQLTIQEGGELYLNERRYFVERGVVTFVSERSIQPDLDILAKTRVSNYDINLRLSGGAEDYSATFTSDPPLPEPDIVSVLLTGRTLEQSRGAELNIAKEQALSYVSGRAASRLSRAAERGLGITSVRIEPNLVARDSNPGARLTIGQDITDVLRFVYSMNLVDPSDQIQILEYDVTKRFLARGTRQQDNTARFDIEHGFQWGGAPVEVDEEATPQGDLTIGEITITGTPVLPEETVREELGLKQGKEYSFFKTQDKLDKLRRFYRKKGYLEARVRAQRQINAETVDIELEIAAGPQVEFSFEGWDAPDSLRKQVRRIWEEGFVDQQRTLDSVDALESSLFRKDYLQATVEHSVDQPSADRKTVTFRVEPGVQYGEVELSFPGVEAFGEDELRELLEDSGNRGKLRDKSGEVKAFLEEYYRQYGRLDANVADPRFEYDDTNRSAQIIVAVEEGPAFRVGEVRFEGNGAFDRDRLLEAAFLHSDAEYTREWMDTWLTRLEELYWTNGYNDVEIDYALEQHDDATVDLQFRIQEGLQGVVEDIAIEGTHDTGPELARKQVELDEGDVLNYRKTIESRRNLYQIGAYSLVDVDPQRLTPDEATGIVPIRMDVKLRERKPFSARYGASYDTERGPGFITDLSMRNKLGAARVLGGRLRYDSEFREARGYVSQPLLFGRHLDTITAGYRSREIFETFITDRTGFSVQQQTRPWKSNVFSYGYRFERTDTFDKDPESIFQVPAFNVAPLQFSWTRETRDEYLNATQGSFMSGGFEWAPSLLGSDIRFIKYVGQYFKYFPLSDPVEVPFGGPPRSRWVYAVGVRAGLGKGLGDQDLIRSERFFGGGSTTLRGFEKDGVGPEDFFGPTGGDATFITNNEIRFPIYRWFEGVGFLDMGNVYERVSDFNPTDLRYSSGFGLRVRTPFVLLRFDYGFILDRKPGEPIGGFYFSIGQAF